MESGGAWLTVVSLRLVFSAANEHLLQFAFANAALVTWLRVAQAPGLTRFELKTSVSELVLPLHGLLIFLAAALTKPESYGWW